MPGGDQTDPEILAARAAAGLPTRDIASHVDVVRDGVDVRGYFAWSLLDNYERAEGYRMRFGIVHVDFTSQRRTLKSSAHWYAKLIKAHREAGGEA